RRIAGAGLHLRRRSRTRHGRGRRVVRGRRRDVQRRLRDQPHAVGTGRRHLPRLRRRSRGRLHRPAAPRRGRPLGGRHRRAATLRLPGGDLARSRAQVRRRVVRGAPARAEPDGRRTRSRLNEHHAMSTSPRGLRIVLVRSLLTAFGGAEHTAALHAAGLQRRGYDVTVLAGWPLDTSHPYYRMLRTAGVAVVTPSRWSARPAWRTLALALRPLALPFYLLARPKSIGAAWSSLAEIVTT